MKTFLDKSTGDRYIRISDLVLFIRKEVRDNAQNILNKYHNNPTGENRWGCLKTAEFLIDKLTDYWANKDAKLIDLKSGKLVALDGGKDDD